MGKEWMMADAVIEIPARKGKAAQVPNASHVKVVNTHGQQVIDTWAFNRDDPTEFMSMEHTRAHTLNISPRGWATACAATGGTRC
jgi:uncharacterized protein